MDLGLVVDEVGRGRHSVEIIDARTNLCSRFLINLGLWAARVFGGVGFA